MAKNNLNTVIDYLNYEENKGFYKFEKNKKTRKFDDGTFIKQSPRKNKRTKK